MKLPRLAPPPRYRLPQPNIPPTLQQREELLQFARRWVKEWAPVPPVPLTELRQLADKLIAETGTSAQYRDYIAVLINNELWRETLAAIPYERRLLLLPKCLRAEDKCRAAMDEFGLLCKQCGQCTIQDLQAEAERLGYAVLVAEGSAMVTRLIQAGKIDAIVGVSCMNVLEKAFPYMEAAAIPGIAIPLLQDGCANTTVDLDWVWDVIHLTSADATRRLDLTALREEVESWFTLDALARVLGPADGQTEQLAREWLARAGKRWRPFLTVATYQALRERPGDDLPDDLRKLAVAVECFHKASLIHDDIEDNDAQRYDDPTLHEQHGVAIALNVGDLLIGEGYRLIRAAQVSPLQTAALLHAAAEGHRQLCLGQGEELFWRRHPSPLSVQQVLNIFRQKTAPAFEVALRFGAIYAGRHEPVSDALGAYSESLGIAYQIRDDLEDFTAGKLDETEPNLLVALRHEKVEAPETRARVLLESYKQEAIRSLRDVPSANLKGLLRRVVGRIFNDVEIKGWCHEFQARNAAGGATRAGAAG